MYKIFKRLSDIILSLILLILASPFLLIIAILIKCTSRGPVLFKQDRIGLHGKVFKICKFRSMIMNAERIGTGVYSNKNDPRVTKIGKLLRATSLDEVPQLINILKGDMSFIGPRPPLTYHPWPIEQYTDIQKQMFDVRPGITGWTQVHGRKTVDWNDRIDYNVWYANNISLWLDIKIFFLTFLKTLANKDNENCGITNRKLDLMYITNNPEIASVAEKAGVDRIFIDLEAKGKLLRQANMNTVKSQHTIDDIKKVKAVLNNSRLLVRVNSIDDESEDEINQVIAAGADIVMLPYYKTVDEVKKFIKYVDKRATVCLLCETSDAVDIMDDVLELEGIDEIHIGLNDLHLCYNMKFMFELLADGTVENLVSKIKAKHIKFGFGGVSNLGDGALPATNIITEHYRLNSTMVILSRGFCPKKDDENMETFAAEFTSRVKQLRDFEKELVKKDDEYFLENKEKTAKIIIDIKERI